MSPAAKMPGTLVANLPCSALASSGILFHASLIEKLVPGPEKPSAKTESGRDDLSVPGCARRGPAVVLDPLDLRRSRSPDVASVVAEEARGLYGIAARVVPHRPALFLA